MSSDETLTRLPARPYPGLRPFEVDEWSIFLGRERMTEEVLRRLGERRIVVVHGRSGAGKSSLVRAGVIPRLTRFHRRLGQSLRIIIMRPSGGPLWNLARALAEAVGRANDIEAITDIRRRFDADGARLSSILGALDSDAHPPACLLIDQFEELLVHARGPGRDEAELFVELLAGAMEWHEGEAELRVLVTMRSEFLGDCAQFDGLAELVNESQYLLPRIGRDELRRAIRRPAELHGGVVESDLVERLLNDTMGNADELPLIQHALMVMWEDAHDRTPMAPELSRQQYEERPGGPAGILSDHADRLYDSLVADGIEPDLIERIFRALTDIDSEGRATRRPCSFRELLAIVDPKDLLEEAVRRILETFARDGASFVVGIPGAFERADVLVDIGHEAFIRCWRRISDPVDGWLAREFQDGLTWRALLVQARDFRKNADSILSATTTEERDRWLGRISPRWTDRHGGGWEVVEALMAASRRARDELQATAARAAAAAAKMLVLESLAVNRLARDHLAAGRAEAALVLASSALPYDNSRPLVPEALGTLVLALQQHLGIVNIRPDREGPARFSPDQSLLATASWMEVQIWSIDSGLELFRWNTGHPIQDIEFAAGGATLIVRLSSTIQLWRVFDERMIDEIAFKESSFTTLLSPDGNRLLVCEGTSYSAAYSTVSLWDMSTARRVYSSLGSHDAVKAVAFHTDGTQLALVVDGYRLVRIDCTSGAVLSDRTLLDVATMLHSHSDPVSCAAFSPDGERLAMADSSGMVTLWETASGRSIDAVRVTEGTIREPLYGQNLVVAPRGNRLLVRGLFDTWIWPTASDVSDDMRKLEGQFYEHRFSPDGMRILARQQGRTVLYDASTGSHRDLEGQSGEFSPDGRHLLTIGGPSIRIYDSERDRPATTLESPDATVTSATFSPDSRHVVATYSDGVVRVWRTEIRKERASLRVQDVAMRSAQYSADGRVILVRGSDGAIRLWTGIETAIPLHGWLDRVFSPDGSLMLAHSGQYSDSVWTDTFQLIDIATGTVRADVPGNRISDIAKAAFSRDGKRLLVHAADQALVWDVDRSMRLGSRVVGLRARSPGYLSADGRLALTLNEEEQRIELWDATTGELIRGIDNLTGDSSFRSEAAPGVMTVREIAGDDNAGSDSATVFESLWDVLAQSPLPIEGIERLVRVQAASSCGRFVVVDSPDRRHPLVATRSGLPVASLEAGGHAAFSLDGSLLALCGGNIRIIESETGEERALLSGGTGGAVAVDFSEDNKRIVSTDNDGTARVWRTDGICEIALEVPGHRILQAKFADGGMTIRLVVKNEVDVSVSLRSIWIGPDAETLIQTARGYLPIALSGERRLEAPLSNMQVGVTMRFD